MDDDRDELDPFVRTHVERALAPYADLLAPDDLDAFRRALVRFFESSPAGKKLVERARALGLSPKDAREDKSGERLRKDVAVLERAGRKYGSGRRGG